jgi:hypothetical protein
VIRRRKRVLILGCGPAGLFAAQAAKNAGADYRILSKRRKSEMFGAQFLQSPIAGIIDYAEQFQVHFKLSGDFLDYKRKVYGDELPDPDAVSEGEFFHDKPAWDIRAAYDRAWKEHQHLIEPFNLTAETFPHHRAVYKPHLTVSTIPLPSICAQPSAHAFTEQSLWAIGDAPERGVFAPFSPPDDNTVLYDGTDERAWHRCAKIQGYSTIEWPEVNRPPLDDVVKISKPIATSCNCWEGRDFIKAGRYGAWHWAGQSHHSYVLTTKALR